jgi:hypothetical protein
MFRRLSAVATAMIAVVGLSCPLAVADPAPLRVLVVGDSVTRGSTGDWTWRYRLWQHLVGTGTAVDFVGPRDDLFERASATFGSQEYVDPAFDRDPSAMWGESLTAPRNQVADLVRGYQPDVILEMLGVDDLRFRVGCDVLCEHLTRFVQEAREVEDQVDVVVGEVPQSWVEGADDFNSGLAELTDSMTTPDSRVVSAVSPLPLVQYTDTYDPAASGSNRRGQSRRCPVRPGWCGPGSVDPTPTG